MAAYPRSRAALRCEKPRASIVSADSCGSSARWSVTRWVLRLTTGRAEFCLAVPVAIYSLHFLRRCEGYNVCWLLSLTRVAFAFGFGFAFARAFGIGAGATYSGSAADDEDAAGSGGSGSGVGAGVVEEASLKILCIRSLAAASCALGSVVSV